jgi:YgiT-type zinc finger domain-containing protein
MTCDLCSSPLVEREVSYATELDGKWIIIERVPAKVCPQCGEKLFSASQVERLQQIAREQQAPCRIVETPVFDFASSR